MSANKAVIIKRRVRRDFTILPNDLIRDRRLSWKAIGLLGYILSLPDDFRLYLDYLAKQKKDGRHSTRAGLKELELAGYLTIRRERGELGKYTQVIWEVTDSPVDIIADQNPPRSGNLKEVNPKEGNPDTENPTLISTNTEQELNTNKTTTIGIQAAAKKPKGSVVGDHLESITWPDVFSGEFRSPAIQVIQKCPIEKQQLVLDEISGRVARGTVRSPIGLLHKLVELANDGRFVPAAALEYRQKLESKARTDQLRLEEKKRLQKCSSPRAKRAARGHLSDLRRTTNI